MRVSRVGDRDERLRSPDFQRAAIESKATIERVAVRTFEPELDVSGSKRNRAILDSIVEAIERGELAGIIVYNLSRLSRLKPLDRIELVERIEAAGGRIISTCEPFDSSTPEGRFQRDLFFSIARMEWEKAAAGFALAKEEAMKAGRPIKARPPFGYKQEREKGEALEVDEQAAAIVVELFQARALGGSYGDVLAIFEEATGRSSSRQTMRDMLRNRTYLGELRYGREVELVKVGAHTAIVTHELFAEVQAVTEERAGDRTGKGSGRASSLLAGIARCEGCGKGLTSTKSSKDRGERRYYKCPQDTRHCQARATIAAAELEELVLERVLEWAGPAADELIEEELTIESRRELADERVAQAERRLRRFEANSELEEADEDAYESGLEERRARLELRRAERDALGEAEELELIRATLRRVLTAGELEDGEPVSVDERRRLLSIVLAGVIVRRRPDRSATTVERADVLFMDAASSADTDESAELLEQAAA